VERVTTGELPRLGLAGIDAEDGCGSDAGAELVGAHPVPGSLGVDLGNGAGGRYGVMCGWVSLADWLGTSGGV
jgi:hypothetical protein